MKPLMTRMCALGAMLLLGCGSTVISTHGLSTTCSVDADCVAVFVGDACQVCGCANAAIALSSQAAYDKERSAAEAWCGPRPKALCAPCVETRVGCSSGTCVVK